jgi:1-aminocyclopropane-1-carboxylate synthase
MLEDQKWMNGFAKRSRERLAAHNKLTREVLDELGVRIYPGSNAGFFVWGNLAPFLPKARDGVEAKDNWEGEAMIARKFMENKVFIMNGAEMNSEEPGWFRFVFSQDEMILREGLKR